MEFSRHNWATISGKICPEMLIFGKEASWTFFFQNILTNPKISEIHFYDAITLVLYGPMTGFASLHHVQQDRTEQARRTVL